ncbi:EamA-like transporter family [Desulfocapsa sulfexigens DSM 10523]|uniref:EamA-like transporter family n=2 Tax=Desulfocapsa TaxID=53318 RepID=M1PAC3_DESSD|nr:EamA-like transporter family [Desulfocapsa sulfexigens DSM 10523]
MSLNYGWLPLIYVGLFEMSITFALWLTALQLAASAARIGILIYITPFFSLLILKTVVEEQIHPATFIGIALIIGSILFQSWRPEERQQHNKTSL